ncbi:MAG: DUF192 domain-containing protein [Proteobacteria bacterium]|nr:DUF192 domain-containing protein [Pseudomonadota bacterium]
MVIELKRGGLILFNHCKVAQSFFDRFLGLMGKKSIPETEALIFPKCSSIHTFFMRMNIDVVFVSETGEVIRVFQNLAPWRMILPVRGARHAIEMGSQLASEKKIQEGDRLSCAGVFG